LSEVDHINGVVAINELGAVRIRKNLLRDFIFNPIDVLLRQISNDQDFVVRLALILLKIKIKGS